MESDVHEMPLFDARPEAKLQGWPKSGNGGVKFLCPPTVIVCFIPYHAKVPKSGGWGTFLPPRWMAAKYFFATGNGALPASFVVDPPSLDITSSSSIPQQGPPSDLRVFRAAREFRACVWLRDCVLTRDAAGATIHGTAAAQIGYTPAWWLSPGERRVDNPRHYDVGLGEVYQPRISWEPYGISISVIYGFKIKKWYAPTLNWLAFGAGIPFMRLKIRYDIHVRTGYVTASYWGTPIPSAMYQLGPSETDGRKMEDATRHQILRTLSTGHGEAVFFDDDERRLSASVILV
jgi:hypothetical protein